ncbi:DUF309 domain-containing protein [Sulfobacillus harzensis]|uniref:DUF309 domain-containing protein n=1 Tax=Sulfobacillus harzensis TaxID=2729629 RepID=A0A7Y0Q3G4_9FIRM|nr:DUF309 domain-containing protein [Sulfobacillus harzensis]NMP22951.1 DUF309 domain-containing protein [Sulfobacillus harzensis]
MEEYWHAFRMAMLQCRYFEAHEILEEPWRLSHDCKLQAAIWVAAAFVHSQRENFSGALRLLKRIEPLAHGPFAEDLNGWIRVIENGGALSPPSTAQIQHLEDWAR